MSNWKVLNKLQVSPKSSLAIFLLLTNLLLLHGLTEELQQQAGVFKKSAHELKNKMWWKNVKLWIIIIVIVLVIIGIIVGVAVSQAKAAQASSS